MGAFLRVIILEGVGFNEFDIGKGAMGCFFFLADVEDSAEEEGLAILCFSYFSLEFP